MKANVHGVGTLTSKIPYRPKFINCGMMIRQRGWRKYKNEAAREFRNEVAREHYVLDILDEVHEQSLWRRFDQSESQRSQLFIYESSDDKEQSPLPHPQIMQIYLLKN